MDGSWMREATWIVHVAILLQLCAACFCHVASSNSPFFFLCHYNGPSQPSDNAIGTTNEIEIIVEVETNPEFYVPGKMYKVGVASSSNFDGFMMTGLYALPVTLAKQSSTGVQTKTSTLGFGVACSIVHSHLSERPKKSVSFLWMAPPAGSGCVHFMATGTLEQQILFKDILALRLCEQGENLNEASLTALHEHGVILREDFENVSASMEIWTKSTDVKFTEGCSAMTFNRAAKLCQNGPQNLTSFPLNMSTAALLQFTTGGAECANETSSIVSSGFVNILFGLNDCRKWTIIDKIAIDSEMRNHLVSLPRLARSEGVCLRWSRVSNSSTSNDCWILDNILVTSTDGLPNFLWEAFDPTDLSSFLFFTGGKVTKKCRSDGNALVFQVPRHILRPISATTRDVDMTATLDEDRLPPDSVLLEQDFDGGRPLTGWLIEGGHVGQECGVIHRKKAAVFTEQLNSSRQDSIICSPFIDGTLVGALSFYVGYGRGTCSGSSQSSIIPIVVYGELIPQTEIHIRELQFSEYSGTRKFVIPISRKLRAKKMRFCLRQRSSDKRSSGKENAPPWAVDNFRLLVWQPTVIDIVLQFRINVGCAKKVEAANNSNSKILVEFSNDGGVSWSSLHTACLPPDCYGPQIPFSSTITSREHQVIWTRITYPLPYASILEPTRFRFRHVGRSDSTFDWAIDDMYVGACRDGCSGRGQCTSTGCICDPGYVGLTCDRVIVSHPQGFQENFSSMSVLTTNGRFQVSGGDLTYQCGIISTGKALVFNMHGSRFFQTSNLNTTETRFLQFTIRMGGRSKKSKCLGPDEPSEGVYVHASCKSGVRWNLLKHIPANGNPDPRRFSINLPDLVRGPACFFRIWQATHSGGLLDVWALDDVSITSDFLNRIYLNFSDEARVRDSLAQYSGVIGPYCASNRTLKVGEPSDGLEAQQIVTNSINIGPSYMLQFELVHQCPNQGIVQADTQVALQFSTDHGVTWRLVQDACLPPTDHCNGLYSQGTVYFASEFKNWKRVTIALPRNTWSPVTMFRFLQRPIGSDTAWAIDNLYIGPECLDLCSGHGLCADGVCRCDKRFYGSSCLPLEKMRVVLSDPNEVRKSYFEVTGGSLLTEEQQKAFGVMALGATFYFSENGVRQLITPDMYTNDTEYLQFFLRIGHVEYVAFVNGSSSSFANITRRRDTECSAIDAVDSSPGILFQYSNDAGNTWRLLKQFSLHAERHRQPHLEYVVLPILARTDCTRMRWWQPLFAASAGDRYPWTLEEIKLGPEFHATPEIMLSNNVSKETVINNDWAFHTTMTRRKFCMSADEAEVFDGVELNRFAITREMSLKKDDVIQFQISIGCTDTFSLASQVHLEYSHDHGISWTFVQDACYPPSSSCGVFREASIYYMGTHGHWRAIVIPVTKEISSTKVLFRWSQQRFLNSSKSDGAFAVRNVYIGRPCPNWCSGRGVCISNKTCACFNEFQGPYCSPLKAHPVQMMDKFDAVDGGSGPMWQLVFGGRIGSACCTLGMSNSLYFGERGTREAATVSLDTRRINKVQFLMRLGCMDGMESTCRLQRTPNESIVMQYSSDNGLSWQTLLYFEYEAFTNSTKDGALPVGSYNIELPKEARTPATNFAWWQPLGHEYRDQQDATFKDTRAPWALDNVLFAADDFPHPSRLFETFETDDTDNWQMTLNGSVGLYCFGDKNVLFFEETVANQPQFAATEDFAIIPATFLQFDLAINCQRNFLPKLDSTDIFPFSIELDFSNDAGHSWNVLNDNGCGFLLPHVGCARHHSRGRFLVDTYGGRWTRVTVPLPSQAVSPSTRFRWKKVLSSTSRSLGWAIDNVYFGHDCPWMCSGHGRCLNRSCTCDVGFDGDYCVPSFRLPREFRDNFDDGNRTAGVDAHLWPEIYGATLKPSCGVVVSGSALNFIGQGLRMAVTCDLDLIDAAYIQFALKLACHVGTEVISLQTLILIQYSSNGGITWHTLKEVNSYALDGLTRHVVPLHRFPETRTNCTRIRFWQPEIKEISDLELSRSVWAVDSVLIGGTLLATPNVLYDTFDEESDPLLDAWLDWPGGHIGNLCNSSEKRRALVFKERVGERASYTRDVRVDMESSSVIQFDIKVGCGTRSTNRYPVRLEFSTDLSRTWTSVSTQYQRQRTSEKDVPRQTMYGSDDDDLRTVLVSPIFYANAEDDWKRIILPLDSLGISGIVRFRWIQGYFSDENVELPDHWGLDNVYVGPSCTSHCSGHGWCLNGVLCQCDTHHEGVNCERPLRMTPNFIKENFDTNSGISTDENHNLATVAALGSSDIWKTVSGAEISMACGTLITGTSLVFNQFGSRQLISRELNLTSTRTLQFYLRIGCASLEHKSHSNASEHASSDLFLHYSVDGGIFWTLLDSYDFAWNPTATAFVSVELHDEVRTESTALRWSQPSVDGSFDVDWAIDQIYVGGENNGIFTLSDDFRNSRESDVNWLLTPGGILQSICGKAHQMLHFAGADDDRFAMTTDIVLNDHNSFLQFELLMGCKKSSSCYSIQLEYSLDAGKSWHLVLEKCRPYDSGCSSPQEASVYSSDVFVGRNLVSVQLPQCTHSKATRFRWNQKRPFHSGHSWALGAVYVGGECPSACGGRGRCLRGECKCEDGWTGDLCDIPKEPLPMSFREEFSSVGSVASKIWHQIKGGVISDLCGTLGKGSAMHFYGGCSRFLQTSSLDLRNVTDIRFIFKFGCISRPVNNQQSVVFQYSDDHGIKWFTLSTLNYDEHRNKRSITVALPSRVQRNGISLRWWQAEHGGRAQGDWALDDVIIDCRSTTASESFADLFDDSRELSANRGRWAYTNNVQLKPYCGSGVSMAVGEGINGAEDAVLETGDIHTSAGHIIEFTLIIGCNITEYVEFLIPPVHLQYSLDGSVTWRLVSAECLPGECDNQAVDGSAERPASIYNAGLHADLKTSRTTIPLTGKLISSAVRFRWIQFASDYPGSFTDSVEWALRDVYIGPSRSHHCHGHGSSRTYPNCTCDDNFNGAECEIQLKGLPTNLKDSFDHGQLDYNHWQLLVGGFVGSISENGNQPSVDGGGVVFNRCDSLRLLETVDLDLRDAKFVFYFATAKHFAKVSKCSSRKHNLHLQYSSDGGITWFNLHELVHSLYSTGKSDYLILPRESRTSSCRLRWWQSRHVGCSSSTSGSFQMMWIIDEVLIGGSDVNPDRLYDNFDKEHLSDDFWFSSHGEIASGFCDSIRSEQALVWNKTLTTIRGSHTGGVVTRELIIGEDYILRFKIVVGCKVTRHCGGGLAVLLEFRTDPHLNHWRLVGNRCFPSNASSLAGCLSDEYHEGTIYTSEAFGEWTQVIVNLPESTISGVTQFRWREEIDDGRTYFDWAIDDVHIGEACSNDCSRPTSMEHNCVRTHYDDYCEWKPNQPSVGVYDDFDFFASDVNKKWTKILGAQLSVTGCGSLAPWGRGKRMLFGGCASRQIITSSLSLHSASKVIFVIKSCNMNLTSFSAVDNMVLLLQYSINRGITWKLVASLPLHGFLKPRRVVYDLPDGVRRVSMVQLRWWQPEHRGPNVDQWALDSVEFVMQSDD